MAVHRACAGLFTVGLVLAALLAAYGIAYRVRLRLNRLVEVDCVGQVSAAAQLDAHELHASRHRPRGRHEAHSHGPSAGGRSRGPILLASRRRANVRAGRRGQLVVL